MKVKEERTRNWTFDCYPESMPADFFEILESFHIPAIVSPLHDQDVDPKTGELKKAHYHVMLCFNGVKTYDQVINIVNALGIKYVERVHDSTALARYFAHLDSPDKHRYDIADYRVFGGLDLRSYLNPTQDQVRVFIGQMMDYIREYRVMEFCDLLDYAKEHERDTWYYALTSCCSNIMIQYIKSYRNKNIGVKNNV